MTDLALDQFCHICESRCELFGTGLVLNKYNVRFFRCPQCRFIQSEKPFWLGEAYEIPIAKADIGYIGRNIDMSKITRALISLAFDPNKRFVDYGGGYGMFVRLMRDAGFDFYRYDRHCANLFAQGFDWNDLPDNDRQSFELVTAFEVFEHLPNPLQEIQSMLKIAPSILFSTVLLPEPAPRLGDWWYHALEYGQHIAFYSQKSLAIIAKKFGLHLCSKGDSIHLLSRREVSPALFRLVTHPALACAINYFRSRPSLLPADFLKITGHSLK